ncbi:MAG: DUF5615 family PIN-like protein [Pleurocapsa sp. MO_226.B13]|nr:DUF5615 family PIN-like protein [Pleurocapsa sp. MO_226.B13]
MAEKIKFHLDENVRNAIAEGLRRREIDVTTNPEQSLIGVSDKAQLKFARSQNRVIFTKEKKSISEIIKGLIFTVVYTEREARIRIISARRANKQEKRLYYDYCTQTY